MSQILGRIEKRLTGAVVDVLWKQWRAIGAGASGKPAERGIVDPEALVLGSLCFLDAESRLWSVTTDWMEGGSRLVSVQRLRNLLPGFSAAPGKPLEELARVAVKAGDARWSSLLDGKAGRRPGKPRAEQGKRLSAGPILDSGPALLLRFRAAFGVGLKADLMVFLIANQTSASVASIARALGYSVPPVFRALQDFVAAGFARILERPAAAEYTIKDAGHWSAVLGTLFPPFWRPWKETMAYSIAVRQVIDQSSRRAVSDYAVAVQLRQQAEGWRNAVVKSGVFVEGFHDRIRLPETTDPASWAGFNDRVAKEIEDWV